MPISSVRFHNFKALTDFSVSLQPMNVLVGPNNSGKSTVLSAFRVLEQALRTCRSRRAGRVVTHEGFPSNGHRILERTLPISIENVHSDYAEADSRIDFRYSNGNHLHVYFPAGGGVSAYWNTPGKTVITPTTFKSAFPDEIHVVPVLGPVEQDEQIVTEETIKRAAGTPRASRHFRNYWRMSPQGFGEFQELVEQTWPGMSITPPEIASYSERRLAMFVSEERMDRELYWSGLGFQVWCQLLTYVSRYKDADLLVIDEPEVYLHPEVQRQLLGILREVHPDILLATHSVEILGEADPSEILLVDKARRSARRLRDIEGVQQALDNIGSIQNLTLTELARSRRLLFVEGSSDYKILRRFAKILGHPELAAGSGLTALESGGFGSWDKIRGLSWGLKTAMSSELKIATVFDRDFRSDDETSHLVAEMESEGVLAYFHRRKEMENYLLCPSVLGRAAARLVRKRGAKQDTDMESKVGATLETITEPLRAECSGQYVAAFCRFHARSGRDQGTLASEATAVFDQKWACLETRLEIVPGKQVLKELRQMMQDEFQITMTDFQILDSFKEDDVPNDLADLIRKLDAFRAKAQR